MTWLFVFYVVIFLPYAATKSGLRVSSGAELPSRARLYTSGIVLQVAMLTAAAMTALEARIELFAPVRITAADVAIGVAWVAIKYVRFWWMYRQPAERADRRMLRRLVPRTPGEVAGYTGLVALASVAEEAAYRGVLFQLVDRLAGGFWMAALASAFVFGVAHAAQGRKAASWAGLLGLGNQIVVLLTGTLWVAIATHFAYDMIVGIVAGAIERRRDAV